MCAALRGTLLQVRMEVDPSWLQVALKQAEASTHKKTFYAKAMPGVECMLALRCLHLR